MDSLTPDKDDLDRFHQERKKTTVKKSPAAPAPADETPPFAVESRRPAPPAGATTKGSAGGGTGWMVAMVLLLVIAVAALSFWQIFRQQATINELQQQLTDATQYINQSKLVVARLEGSLNETEANVTQSGSQLSNRLSNLDSEIRKLWDVANKRNIELIKASQAKIESLEASAKRLEERLQTTEQTAQSAAKAASDQQARIDTVARTADDLKGRVAQVEQTATARIESQTRENQAQMTALSKKLESLNAAVSKQSASGNVDGRLKEVETAIDSIDVNRQQLNRRVVELERRLNETQLRVDSFQSP